MSARPMLAVIPARGGSKGLPGKNVRPLHGLPLIAHSIRCAALCPEIDRCIVSTDSTEIAGIAREHGADVPFLRPAKLAGDESPLIPVLKHALGEAERADGRRYGSLLLLDPTSPGRLPADVTRAVELLEADPRCVGVVAVSELHFAPRWNCVEEKAGYLSLAFASPREYTRRQEVPPVYRINGALYLWRRDFLLRAPLDPCAGPDPHRMLIIPDERGISIDRMEDFRLAELLLGGGALSFPWLPAAGGV